MLSQILWNGINFLLSFKETTYISKHLLGFSLFQALQRPVFPEMNPLSKISAACWNIH